MEEYKISETDTENCFYCICSNNFCCFLAKDKSTRLFIELKKINERIKIDGEFLFMGRDGKFVKTFGKKTIDSHETEPDQNNNGTVNLKKFVDNKYIITYDDDSEIEITLYGPDKENNYTTTKPLNLFQTAAKCVGNLCLNSVYPKGGSKTRKRRKSKRHINKLN